jgi:hypothetical protein
MTLDSSGNLLVGKTGANDNTNGFAVYNIGASIAGALSIAASTPDNTSSGFRQYSTGAGAYRFYVGYGGTINATSTSISAISDESLKENIRDLDEGLETVMALKPRKFDWKENKGKNNKGDRGWIAQEFEQVFPGLIEEAPDRDMENNDLGTVTKTIKTSVLVPMLVKAIQELTARVQYLENK